MTHPTKQQVFIFLDNSNIFIPAQDIVDCLEGRLGIHGDVRISVPNLLHLASAGRPVAQAFCAGTQSLGHNPFWKALRDNGVKVELFEPGAFSGDEQAIDATLQLHMLRACLDQAKPGVIVLLTGDGAGYKSGNGFYADLERLSDRGWGVEVIAWDKTCNPSLKSWVSQKGVYVALERHYLEVTYRAGGRSAVPVSLRRRFRTSPTLSSSMSSKANSPKITTSMYLGHISGGGAQQLVMSAASQHVVVANSPTRPILKLKRQS